MNVRNIGFTSTSPNTASNCKSNVGFGKLYIDSGVLKKAVSMGLKDSWEKEIPLLKAQSKNFDIRIFKSDEKNFNCELYKINDFANNGAMSDVIGTSVGQYGGKKGKKNNDLLSLYNKALQNFKTKLKAENKTKNFDEDAHHLKNIIG